jgi:outer membrane protein assembly factor BamB
MTPFRIGRIVMSGVIALSALYIAPGCTAQSSLAGDDFRTLTDSQGRKVEAKVLEVRGDRVTILRRDGREFTASVATFSEADQAYFVTLLKQSPVSADRVGGHDWPSFRGPTGMGVSDAERLPVQWSDDSGIVWKTPLPGAGSSSPITLGDQIYLTCYTGYYVPGEPDGNLQQLRRHLIALRRDTGEIVWDAPVQAKLPEEENIRDHGFAANTPAADADAVYAFFGKSGVIAFDHQGKQLWATDVGSGTNGWGTASSPVLYKDLVIINASVESESLIALDRRTGKEVWRAGDIRESWNTPIIVTADSGREELVVARLGDVLAFDPATGKPLWSCKTDIAWYMVPSPVAADGIVYFLGGRSGTAGLAVRAGGEDDVTATRRLWTSQAGSNVPSPIYLEGHLYWISQDGGIAYCANAATGELVYEKRLQRIGQVYASPLLAAGRLYYIDRDGKTVVLAAKPEFELIATNTLNDRSVFDASPAVDASPADDDGRLLLRSGKFLYCIGN